ncbi:MAG: discoidin domain-containing protein [Planctomycetota bacterium]
MSSFSSAYADIVTGVTASTTLGRGGSGPIRRIVDGSGLPSGFTFSSLHEGPRTNNAWVSAPQATPKPDINGQIDFDLGGLYSIDSFAVWNTTFPNEVGVNDISVETSTDGVNFSALVGGPSSFTQGNGISTDSQQAAEVFTFNQVTASHFRFNILSNFNPGLGFPNLVGLQEVAFNGISVPEPSGFVCFGLFALMAVGFRERRLST